MRFRTIVFKNLVGRPWRSALTCLGIAVAVATVIALLGVAYGFKGGLEACYQMGGVDLIVLRAGAREPESSHLSQQFREKLRQIDGIHTVSGTLFDAVDVENALAVPLRGVEADSGRFDHLSVIEG